MQCKCTVLSPCSHIKGTGFIGFVRVRGDYFTALITNNHVVSSLEDAMSSRITFEQVPTIKLCNLIDKGTDNFFTSPQNEVWLLE